MDFDRSAFLKEHHRLLEKKNVLEGRKDAACELRQSFKANAQEWTTLIKELMRQLTSFSSEFGGTANGPLVGFEGLNIKDENKPEASGHLAKLIADIEKEVNTIEIDITHIEEQIKGKPVQESDEVPYGCSRPTTRDEETDLKAKISGTELQDDNGDKQYGMYLIKVDRLTPEGPVISNVRRRYSDFDDLHVKLTDKFGTSSLGNLHLPKKTFIGDTSKSFLEERGQGLDVYLKELLSPEFLVANPGAFKIVSEFLEDGDYIQEKGRFARTVVGRLSSFFKTRKTPRSADDVAQNSSSSASRETGENRGDTQTGRKKPVQNAEEAVQIPAEIHAQIDAEQNNPHNVFDVLPGCLCDANLGTDGNRRDMQPTTTQTSAEQKKKDPPSCPMSCSRDSFFEILRRTRQKRPDICPLRCLLYTYLKSFEDELRKGKRWKKEYKKLFKNIYAMCRDSKCSYVLRHLEKRRVISIVHGEKFQAPKTFFESLRDGRNKMQKQGIRYGLLVLISKSDEDIKEVKHCVVIDANPECSEDLVEKMEIYDSQNKTTMRLEDLEARQLVGIQILSIVEQTVDDLSKICGKLLCAQE